MYNILNIETNITALDADYENFMRTNEENTVEQNKSKMKEDY